MAQSKKDMPKRYRAGKMPEWAKEAEVDDTPAVFAAAETKEVHHPVSDPRLQRLALSNLSEGDQNERLERHRRPHVVAEVIEDEDEAAIRRGIPLAPIMEGEAAEIAEHLIERRERLRRAQQREESEEELLAEQFGGIDMEDEEESEADSEESEDESDDEEFEGFGTTRARLRPQFVVKQKRVTIAEKELEEAKEKEKAELQKQQVEERKERTLQVIRDHVERERLKTLEDNPDEPVLGSDDDDMEIEGDDDSDDETVKEREYEKWKLRELQRIRRDREERDEAEKLAMDIERRRLMSDQEVAAEKLKLGEGVKEQKKMKFLQKYYHKGAFYAEELGTLDKNKHDWVAPTGEDTIADKAMLPKVLQVKNFGLAGRTKYTHLVDQDTTAADDPWARAYTLAVGDSILGENRKSVNLNTPDSVALVSAAAIVKKQSERMGGRSGGFNRPTKRRRLDSDQY